MVGRSGTPIRRQPFLRSARAVMMRPKGRSSVPDQRGEGRDQHRVLGRAGLGEAADAALRGFAELEADRETAQDLQQRHRWQHGRELVVDDLPGETGEQLADLRPVDVGRAGRSRRRPSGRSAGSGSAARRRRTGVAGRSCQTTSAKESTAGFKGVSRDRRRLEVVDELAHARLEGLAEQRFAGRRSGAG